MLFEIPVYRVSPDDWLAEVEQFAAKARAAYLRQLPAGQEPNPQSVESYERMLLASNDYNVPYEYNQVVGWVRVEWDGPGPSIKAYAYKVPQKRVRRGFSRRYEWEGKVFELLFIGDESPEEIADEVRSELMALTQGKELFAKRYADLEAFDCLAPRLDWRRLIGLEE
ncbi:MAG: hypothetical protein ACRDHO_15250 [Actinomycetota bacterium]